jgi:succinate dehydrogenase flavin-adding protein (antitoxin of CptAB toxin-antitoxin module)
MTLNSLKKIIKYRSTYSGTKETDILYKENFIKNLDKFSEHEMKLLISVFDIYSDDEIYSILTKKKLVDIKFKNLFEKINKF